MTVEYLLITGGREMLTTGQYVPRKGEVVQISGSNESDGMYNVHEVINWTLKKGEKGKRESLDAGLPRVMLLEDN